MSETNGKTAGQGDVPSIGLQETIVEHQRQLLALNTLPNGAVAIDPRQLFVDAELSSARLEVLFEMLVELGLIDPARIAYKLKEKLEAEIADLKRQRAEKPIVEHVRGTLGRT